jgi:GDPmannose 4,6-dehydratase
MHYGDLTDSTNLIRITKPCAWQLETREYTVNADAVGTLRLLEGIRILRMENRVRFYQASTSELYGKAQEVPQTEKTSFYPRSHYAAAKLYAYWITVNYREAYGLHASNGILFNHDGTSAGRNFLTRKVTRAVAAIHLGQQNCLYIGNLDTQRDWGHARDHAEKIWLMLQQPEPDDYVLATEESHWVREFVELAFAEVGIRDCLEGYAGGAAGHWLKLIPSISGRQK